jgi:hypothetical protein
MLSAFMVLKARRGLHYLAAANRRKKFYIGAAQNDMRIIDSEHRSIVGKPECEASMYQAVLIGSHSRRGLQTGNGLTLLQSHQFTNQRRRDS